MIASACKQANHRQDLAQFVRLAATAGNELSSPNNAGIGQSQAQGQLQASLNLETNQFESLAGERQFSERPTIRYHQFQAPSPTQAPAGAQYDSKNMVS